MLDVTGGIIIAVIMLGIFGKVMGYLKQRKADKIADNEKLAAIQFAKAYEDRRRELEAESKVYQEKVQERGREAFERFKVGTARGFNTPSNSQE
jgi:hypothetical protein